MSFFVAQRSGWKPFRHFLRAGVAAAALAVMPCPVLAQSDEAAVEPMPQDPSLVPPVPMAPPTTMEQADALADTLYPDERAEDQVPASSQGVPTRPWKLTLHGSVSEVYDSNIFIASRHREADLVSTLSPGFKFTLGDWLEQKGNYVTLDYTLSGLIFADHSSQDAIEQEAALDAQWVQARFTFGLQFRFQDLTSPDIDVGDRTRRRIYETALLSKYEIREQVYVEANLYNVVSDYETRLSSYEWIGRFWLDYASTPKMTFGPGVSVGYLNVENSPSQTYERVLGRMTYSATDKLLFEADGGVEIRQAGHHDRVEPILNITGTYHPYEATELKLTASRKVQNSAALAGENYTFTGVDVEVSRTVRAGCDLVLGGGYGHSDYQPTESNRAREREDDYFFVKPSVRFLVAERLHVDFFYLYQENESTRGLSSFGDHQAGARIRFDY